MTDPIPTSVVDYAKRLVDADVIPELTDHQRALLEIFDGTRDVPTAEQLYAASRRAGRRQMRAIIAAHALLSGERVTFIGDNPQQAAEDALIFIRAAMPGAHLTTDGTLIA